MGGKRIRPVLMLMAYNLYREDITRIFNPATGIEVYHNYTLCLLYTSGAGRDDAGGPEAGAVGSTCAGLERWVRQ